VGAFSGTGLRGARHIERLEGDLNWLQPGRSGGRLWVTDEHGEAYGAQIKPILGLITGALKFADAFHQISH